MHYVVIENIGNKIKIYDPYFGKRIYTKEEFLKIWTKVIIILENKSVVKEVNDNILYKKVLNKYKYRFVLISMISLVLIILSIIESFYLKILIDNVHSSKRIDIVFTILIIIRYILEYIINKSIIKLDMCIDKDITLKIIKNILSLKEDYFINRQIGDVLSRINNIDKIKTLLFKIPIQFFMHINIIIICVIVLISLSKSLFFTSLLIVLVYSLIYILFFNKNKQI